MRGFSVIHGVSIALTAPRVQVGSMSGSPTAREADFARLYAVEYPALAAFCWQALRDRGAAEELAQEAFTRLYGRWISVEQPRAYLYRIAANLIKDSWKRREADSRTLEGLRVEHELLPGGPDTAAAVAVRVAVGRLPSRLRPVVLLHYYGDFSVADVAKILRRPEGSIKRQLAEARDLLAGNLMEDRT